MSSPAKQPTLNSIQGIGIIGLPTVINNTLLFDAVNGIFVWGAGGGGGGGDKITLIGSTGAWFNNSSNEINFSLLNSFAPASFTAQDIESSNVVTIDWALTLKRILLRIQTNSSSNAIVMGIRDDGVTVAKLTIPTATTGEFDTGDLTVLIASGSEVCWILDSFGNTGNYQDYSISAWGFET